MQCGPLQTMGSRRHSVPTLNRRPRDRSHRACRSSRGCWRGRGYGVRSASRRGQSPAAPVDAAARATRLCRPNATVWSNTLEGRGLPARRSNSGGAPDSADAQAYALHMHRLCKLDMGEHCKWIVRRRPDGLGGKGRTRMACQCARSCTCPFFQGHWHASRVIWCHVIVKHWMAPLGHNNLFESS